MGHSRGLLRSGTSLEPLYHPLETQASPWHPASSVLVQSFGCTGLGSLISNLPHPGGKPETKTTMSKKKRGSNNVEKPWLCARVV